MKSFAQFGILPICLVAGLLVSNLVSGTNSSHNADQTVRVPENKVEFNRDIRTILSDNCFSCHGPDEGQRQAGLRLDNRESATEDLGGYAAIVPGKPDESALIERILSEDEDEMMPPAEHRKKLTEVEKKLLVQWIREGAEWQEHWSLIQPSVRKTARPGNGWSRNRIDDYIFQRLQAESIRPSQEADRRILIRRLYFDLIGLPPTPKQVQAFLDDHSPGAYEKVVDELLSSRHFGERLAIYWLDQVRYADTVGYHGDQDVSISPYRDYVIGAFNSNMPFDQFTREQLAGDLIPNATLDQKIASGYNRLGMMSAEGGVQPEEYLAKYAADRVRTTASVWLGMTLGCAECHDHKFDPFSIEDFYNFAAFFADIKERGLYSGANSTGDWGPRVEVPDSELAGLLKPIDVSISQVQDEMSARRDSLLKEQLAWEENIRKQTIRWKPLRPNEVFSYSKSSFKILDDESLLFGGKATNEDAYVIQLKPDQQKLTGIRLEVLPDKSLPQRGPGRAGNGNFVLTEVIAARGKHQNIDQLKTVIHRWPKDLAEHVLPLKNATATAEQTQSAGRHPDKKWSAASAIDRERHGPTWGWAILPERGKKNEWVARFDGNPSFAGDEILTLVLHQYHGNGNHILGRFRVSVTSDPNPVADPLQSLPADVRQFVQIKKDQRTPAQRKRLSDYFVSVAPSLKTQREKLAKLNAERSALVKKHTRTTLVTQAVKPREMRVLPRGDWMNKSGKVVSPATPKVLPPMKQTSGTPTRMDLANWLVSDTNPLTARVFVNRLWKLYFGQGLAKVLDDMGSQGGWPSHPELLDYLAVEFVESGWDVKHVIRLMVTSSTYRQSSQLRKELKEIDPENRLLARQARYRLEAELIRDNMLATSGLLVRKIGGRSVKPYQPPGLYRHLNFPARRYQPDSGESQFRRGLYTHWQRQFLHPAMKSFDAPAREECTCERPISNTPLAALVLLNDPSYVEAARNLAQSSLAQESAKDPEQRIKWMFRQALLRAPNDSESSVLHQLFETHLDHFKVHPDEAKQVTSIGLSKSESDGDHAELAAYISVARTIFNLHEFITRY